MPKKVGKSFFIFGLIFYLLQKDQKCLLGINIINSTRKHTYNEIKNIEEAKEFDLKHYLCNSEIF